MENKVICYCGKEITEIDWNNRENEEGEAYVEVRGKCVCGNDFEASVWGEFENDEQAKECLIDYIKERQEE